MAEGLKMLVSNDGRGFQAAYQQVYWIVPHQRCVFHKLKNLERDLKFDNDMTPEAQKDVSKESLCSASKIWQDKDKTETFCRYQDFCSQWQQAQPKAIQTLQRDFDATLTFYDVMEQAKREGQTQSPHLLRPTSPPERTFREFRQRFPQSALFYSPAGAQAATAQLASGFS